MCLSLPRICFLAYIHTHTHIYTHTHTLTHRRHIWAICGRERGRRGRATGPAIRSRRHVPFSLSLSLSLSSPQQSCTTRRGVLSELNNIALARNTRPLKLLSPTGGGLITKTQTYFFFPPASLCLSDSLASRSCSKKWKKRSTGIIGNHICMACLSEGMLCDSLGFNGVMEWASLGGFFYLSNFFKKLLTSCGMKYSLNFLRGSSLICPESHRRSFNTPLLILWGPHGCNWLSLRNPVQLLINWLWVKTVVNHRRVSGLIYRISFRRLRSA